VGAAFQLVDDVLDYSGDHAEIGKNLGDDLNEGKPTLPLIYAMSRGTPAQADVVRRAIESGGRDGFDEVLGTIRATGALEYTRAQAEREALTARNAIARLPSTPFKESLLDLSAFAADRSF
jgi:octaprenyl-diphosphate synthase